jgi:hypothetical protein
LRGTQHHCEPFDAACGVAQDKPLLRSSEAIQAGSPRRSAPRDDGSGGHADLVLRHSKRRGAQLVKVGKGRWSVGAERAFLASLGETGCIRRAARAAGFSTTTIHSRLNNYPAFAEAAQAAIRRAKADLESMVLSAGIATFDPAAAEDDEARPRVTVSEAIAFLRLNPSAKGAGKGQHLPIEEPSIEEVRDEVLRRIAAIRRHGDRSGEPEA